MYAMQAKCANILLLKHVFTSKMSIFTVYALTDKNNILLEIILLNDFTDDHQMYIHENDRFA